MTSDKDQTGVRADQESDNETGDELGDYKEPQEEELSLLGHSLDTNTPVPVIRAPLNRHKHYSAGSNILQTSPSAMQRLRDSSSSDIQIAAESELSRERARFSLETSSPSLRALCGPNPAKISLVCVLVISVWLMAVLVIHLDKKLALTTETLEDTREKIQNIQDAVEGDRHETQQQIHNIEQKLRRLMKLRRSGSKKNAVSESPTASIQPGSESTQTNSSGKVEDDWESDDWSF